MPSLARRIGAAGFRRCSRASSARGIAAEIGFGQHDAVGNGRLLHRFHLPVELIHAVDRIDGRDHPIETIEIGKLGILDQRMEDGRGVGQARRLDDHAAEGGISPRPRRL